MSEAEKRLHRCCFTGHRPEKLLADEKTVCQGLAAAIQTAIGDGYRSFITGMARGVDIWAAEQVLICRKENPDIRLICALPHPDFEKNWRQEWQKRYNAILRQADAVKIICPAFSMGSYQKRNVWMVDHSNRLIAVYNGESGGTANTIRDAMKKGLDIVYAEGSRHLTEPAVCATPSRHSYQLYRKTR